MRIRLWPFFKKPIIHGLHRAINHLLTLIFLTSALASFILHLHPQRGFTSLLIWAPKVLAATFTPVLTFINLIAMALGLLGRDWRWSISGAVGATLSTHYFYQIQRPSPGFDEVFGPDWQDHVPARLRPSLLPRGRWTMLLRAPRNVRREIDVEVGTSPATGQDILANIWLPPTGVRPNRAAVIYVHGGAWIYGDKDNTQRPTFRHLAGQGYVVMDVAYTLWPDSDLPHMVQEVKQAILWLKRHSQRYGIDVNAITLSGASAGGHLALLAAYTPGHPAFQPPGDDGDASVRSVIAFYPPVDFRAMYNDMETIFGGFMRDRRVTFLAEQAANALKKMGYIPQQYEVSGDLNIIRHMLGGSPDEIPDVYELLSPIHHVDPRDPPTLIFQGEDDFFRLAPSLRELQRKLKATGVPTIYIEFPYTPHGFDLFLPQISPVALRAFREMDRFLHLINFTQRIPS